MLFARHEPLTPALNERRQVSRMITVIGERPVLAAFGQLPPRAIGSNRMADNRGAHPTYG
jgi:hypothetical protein